MLLCVSGVCHSESRLVGTSAVVVCECRLRCGCDALFEFRGPKWPILKQVFAAFDVSGYEYVWLPDDDLDISCTDINTMFMVAEKHS